MRVVDQEVGWFYIEVHKVVVVNVLDASEHLLEVLPDLLFAQHRNATCRFDQERATSFKLEVAEIRLVACGFLN